MVFLFEILTDGFASGHPIAADFDSVNLTLEDELPDMVMGETADPRGLAYRDEL